jgi:serine/threonine protein kinase
MEENWRNEPGLNLVMDKIGVNYELLDYLGGGGLAKIYKLRHQIFDKYMALKIMDYNYIYQNLEKSNVEDIGREFKKIKKRFEDEARIYKKFSHPGIVKIHQVGFVRYETRKIEIPYLIMEFIEGATLKEILKKKSPLDPGTIFRISGRVIEALGVIHKAGIIHRDIKPSNIMIREKNQEVVLIDFGLAKNIENSSDSSGITVTSTAMGTAKYNSPEMFRSSKNISIETDIYSFGVILYEMVTGEAPFKGSIVEIIYGHLNIDKTIPEKLFPNNTRFAGGINQIIKKAMAKEAKDRYRSANEFLNALKDLEKSIEQKDLEEEPKKEDKPKISLKKPLIYLFAVLVIVIAVFIVINPYKYQGHYEQLISHAIESIQNKDYETAISSLERAKEIKDTDEIKSLLAEITGERIAGMKADFDDLKAFLNGEASNKDKLVKCQEFLNKHQDLPENKDKAAMISETNTFITQLETEIGKDEQYQKCIDAANQYIKNEEYQKAIDELEEAKKIRETEEITVLLIGIREKQIEIMKGDFYNLKQFLEGAATKKEKLDKCQKFLEKHKNTPGNKPMVNETNQFISQLNAEIRTDEQYQQHIDSVKRSINNGDYQKAEDELKKARDIKDTDEVKRFSVTISKGLEAERKNGTKEYNAIKDNLDRSKYLAFKNKYRDSIYLPDLRNRLKIEDRNLPPEKYWENPIKKNKKGCYELTFGRGNIRHIMIYIPENKIWIDKYEVSWKQYRGFLAAEGKKVPPIKKKIFKREEDEYPVFTTYSEARQYCKRYGFRLPKENEWEYAAGKGSFTYPWGNELPDANETFRANFVSFTDGFKGTAPVKSFEKFSSPFGAVNMAGNVWEWVTGGILKGGGFTSDKKELEIKQQMVKKRGSGV